MDKYGGEWAMADIEAYDELVANGLVPGWGDVQRFHDRWYQVESRVMAWYVAGWVWSGKLGSPDLTGLRGPLINANYPGVSGAPAQAAATLDGRGFKAFGGRKPDIWQFGSSLTVPGASSNTDCNIYPGTVEQLVQLLTGKSTPTGGDEMLYVAAVKGKDGTTNWYVGDGLYYTKIITWPEHEFRVGNGAKEKAFDISDDWQSWTGRMLASNADLDAGELDAIKQAALSGAGAALTAAIPSVVEALIAKLPANAMTREDVEDAVRDAFKGGLAPDADAPAA
jgi:hypothetical protein